MKPINATYCPDNTVHTGRIKGTLSATNESIVFTDESGNAKVALKISEIGRYQLSSGTLILNKKGMPILVSSPKGWIYRFVIVERSNLLAMLAGIPLIGLLFVATSNKIAQQSQALRECVEFLESKGVEGKNIMSIKNILMTCLWLFPLVIFFVLLVFFIQAL